MAKKTWKELEQDFLEMEKLLEDAQIDIQWGCSGEHVMLAGVANIDHLRRFRTIAYIAGKKLAASLENEREQHKEILAEDNPVTRWYLALWKIGNYSKYGFSAQIRGGDGRLIGDVFKAKIPNVIEASMAFARFMSEKYGEPVVTLSPILRIIRARPRLIASLLIGLLAAALLFAFFQ